MKVFRWLLLCGVFSLLLLICFSFLNQHFWLFDLFSSFLLQYSVLLISGGFLLLFFRHKNIATISVLVGVYIIWQLYPKGGNPLIIEESEMSIASINVLSSNTDTTKLFAYLNDKDPDVFFILEYTPFWAKVINEKYGDQYPNKVEQAQLDNFGIALFSKYELVNTELLDFTNSYFPVISSTLIVDTMSIRILGTHYENPVGANNSIVRNHQIRKTIEYMSSYDAKIVLGDFNTTPYSRVFSELLASLHLKDSRGGHGISASWPTYFSPMMIPIDHFLHSPEIYILMRELGPNINSDHLPLYVELSW